MILNRIFMTQTAKTFSNIVKLSLLINKSWSLQIRHVIYVRDRPLLSDKLYEMLYEKYIRKIYSTDQCK